MASVSIEFLPPTDSDIVALHIYEATAPDQSFNQIERTTEIGTYPSYITEYTTDNATSDKDWFSISWENAGGVISPLSAPVQGGTSSLVGIITDRVMMRDPLLNRNVVVQEAESAIAIYFNQDPYTVDPDDVTYQEMRGLTYMTMAGSYVSQIVTVAATTGAKWVAGLVSLDMGGSSSSSTGIPKAIEDLINLANHDLNKNYSVILHAAEIGVAGGYKISHSWTGATSGVDLTRGIVMVNID